MRTKEKSFPIIHIIGLPGAGKTTLAGNLAKKWNLTVYRIGNFLSKFSSSVIGEADAWVTLFLALSKKRCSGCILETTGLNRRETFLTAVLPFDRIVRIKLCAKKSVLHARVRKKPKNEQRNDDWVFGDSYKDKYEFIKKLYGEFKKALATITIDTDKLTVREVHKTATKELSFYLDRCR